MVIGILSVSYGFCFFQTLKFCLEFLPDVLKWSFCSKGVAGGVPMCVRRYVPSFLTSTLLFGWRGWHRSCASGGGPNGPDGKRDQRGGARCVECETRHNGQVSVSEFVGCITLMSQLSLTSRVSLTRRAATSRFAPQFTNGLQRIRVLRNQQRVQHRQPDERRNSGQPKG